MLFPYFSIWVTKADRGEGQVTAEQALWGWGVGGAAGWSCWCVVGVAVRMQRSPSAFLPVTITGYSGPLIHPSKRQIHFAPAVTARSGRMCVLLGAWGIYPRGRFPFNIPTLANMIKQKCYRCLTTETRQFKMAWMQKGKRGNGTGWGEASLRGRSMIVFYGKQSPQTVALGGKQVRFWLWLHSGDHWALDSLKPRCSWSFLPKKDFRMWDITSALTWSYLSLFVSFSCFKFSLLFK